MCRVAVTFYTQNEQNRDNAITTTPTVVFALFVCGIKNREQERVTCR